ncbi:MAG: hypothetical protein IPJ41_04520 [Phycisphaerales bacterium]|nr:hypothetical protein [Phycisphaerales bacterium]
MTDRVIPFSAAAQAYRSTQPARPAQQPAPVARVSPTDRQPPRDTLDLSSALRQRSRPASPLAAAKVAGSVSFDAAAPAIAKGALPIYSNPAARNAAATNINAGRLIDTQA